MATIIEDEEGSISPLISIYFVIIMSSIFVLSNVAGIYIDRRTLINQTESSLFVASQQLDEFAYYYQLPSQLSFGASARAVPIDCREAFNVFQQALRESSVEDTSTSMNQDNVNSSGESYNSKIIRILMFQCDGRNLRAKVSGESELKFSFPSLGIKNFRNEVEVGISTTYQN